LDKLIILKKEYSDIIILNPSTKGKGPWDLIYSKMFETRSEAIIHELKLKKIKNTHFILRNLDKL